MKPWCGRGLELSGNQKCPAALCNWQASFVGLTFILKVGATLWIPCPQPRIHWIVYVTGLKLSPSPK